MSNQQLKTQAELQALNTALADLAGNLSEHVNGSLSPAHGFSALASDYSDSAGDLLGDKVLRLAFGDAPNTVIVYVPLQSTATPPPSSDGGLIAPSSAATGSARGPGTPPARTALVTQFAQAAIQNVELYNRLLLAHAETIASDTSPQAHGGMALINKTTLDELGHTVGRRVVQINVAGVQYELPCDVRADGPPKAPRIDATACPQFVSGAASPNGPCSLFYSGNSLGGQFIYSAEVLGGDVPGTYNWQTSSDLTNWSDVMLNVDVISIGSHFRLKPTFAANPPSGSFTTVPQTIQFQFTLNDTADSSNQTESPAFFLRCKFTNSAGSVATLHVTFGLHDQTDSCVLFTAALDSGVCTWAELKELIRFRLHVQRKDWLADQAWLGYILGFRGISERIRNGRAGLFRFFGRAMQSYARWRMGTGPFEARWWAVFQVGRVYAIFRYLLNRAEARKIGQRLNGAGLVAMYKRLAKRSAPRR